MLENIKSKYIIVKIFGLLNIRHKLKIIAYNKSIQDKCSININDYKNTSGYFAIKEANGKYQIKTIKNDILIYEGDYFKGKKNGEGKLYKIIDAKLSELEAQLLNGLIMNKYKEFIKCQNANIENKICTKKLREGIIKKNGEKYFYFSYLEYEGGFKNGIKNGKGKEYFDNGNLRYEGDFKNGAWDGKGKEYDGLGNLIFEGEFWNNLYWNGKQKFYDKHGNLEIEYEIFNGRNNNNGNIIVEGREYDVKGNLIFEGDYDKLGVNRWKGKEKEYDNNGNVIFECEYKNGKICNEKGKGNDFPIGEYKSALKLLEKEEKNYIKIQLPEKFNLFYLHRNLKNKLLNIKDSSKNNTKFKEFNNEMDLIFNMDYPYENKQDELMKDTLDEIDAKGIDKSNENFILGEGFPFGKRKIYDNHNNLLFEIDSDEYSLLDDKEILYEIYSTDKGKNGFKLEEGKEVNFKNNSIFEGEFLNGIKWNGIIKIYNKLKIEENEINVEEKERKKYNILRFESEFKDGKIDGKRKEYDHFGNLIFEGNYLNGKKNGKGKEFFDFYDDINKEFKFIKLLYEGDYLDGEINGQGKESIIFCPKFNNPKIFDKNEKEYKFFEALVFEGEYIKGKRHKGKEYYENGNLRFEGEYEDGVIWKGKEFDKNENIKSEGEYKNGKLWDGKKYNEYGNIISENEYKNGKIWKGKVKEYDSNKNLIFERNYQNGKRNGEGISFDNLKRIIFKGDYIDNDKWNGIEYNYQGIYQFEQEYKLGKKIGKVIMKEIFKGIIRFEAESLNFEKNGKGKEYFKKVLIFEGEYLNGKRNGYGIEYNFDCGKFEGIFKEGLKWVGTGYDKNGEIDYDIIDGCGILKEYYEGKLIYEGECLKGKRDGKGKEYDFLTGKLKYKGIFANGKFMYELLE